MTRTQQTIAIFLAAVLSMGVIGFVYERCVQPQEPVWATGGRAVHWEASKLPLDVWWAEDTYPRATRMAIASWNQAAGCELFREHSKGEPDVSINLASLGDGPHGGEGVAGAFYRDGKVLILLYQPLIVGPDLVVIHHELGRALGLADDVFGTMKPNRDVGMDAPLQTPFVTEMDAAALNARYCL